MQPDDSDRLSADRVVDELMPDELDWRRTVRRYPLASIAIAALGGYILGRTRGLVIVSALSSFAADSVASQVNDVLGRNVL